MKITDSMQCDIWYQALLERAVEFTGVFFVGVKTTGVFCISVCRARKPRRENVEFYNDFKSALDAGFRPCKVCRPTENARTAPAFVEQALRLLREAPKVRLSDSELRQHDISPERVRRWFLQNHGITFQAFQRMQRLNMALQELKAGRSTTDVAFDSGYESLSGFGYTCKKIDRFRTQRATPGCFNSSFYHPVRANVCLCNATGNLSAGVCRQTSAGVRIQRPAAAVQRQHHRR